MRDDVLVALAVLPENLHEVGRFTVKVEVELVSIPNRVYHDPALIHTDTLGSLQKRLVDCILTRHCDGFVRQKHLARIVASDDAWVPPFVVQLLGEYVIEIIRVIDENLGKPDSCLYTQFLQSNPDFLALTAKRVTSYWNCYYRSYRSEEYVGFRVLRFLRELANDKT
jgi:hypothetical protein